MCETCKRLGNLLKHLLDTEDTDGTAGKVANLWT